MKIDIVVSSLKSGGAERVAANLANSFSSYGHQVRVLIQTPLTDVEYAPREGVVLESFNNPNRYIRALKLRHLLKTGRASVVVAVQANMAIIVGLVSIGLNLRVIGCEHNVPQKAVWGRFWNFLRPLAYRALSAVTVLTSSAKEELASICPKVRIEVVPNALILPLTEGTNRLDPKMIVKAEDRVLLAAGRLVEAKGFDRMIICFSKLSDRMTAARLVIVGEGPLRPSLEALVQQLGLNGKVILPGRAGNIADWYRRADLFLMTSRWEGQPMVLMEAMGHGVPAIVTDFYSGPRDIICDNVDGMIFPDDCPEECPNVFADAVEKLLMDEPLRRSFSSNALLVRERFSEETVYNLWMDLFKSICTLQQSH